MTGTLKNVSEPHAGLRETICMSIVASCARTAEVIGHARSLYGGGHGTSRAPDSTACLRQSAEETTAASRRTGGLTGATIDAYQDLDARVASDLISAAQSDAQVGAHLEHAATAVRAGAARLDALVEENNATMAAAQRARTPAQEAAVLRALRYQVSRTQQIVADTGQQASGLATGIQAVDYQRSPPPAPPPTPAPAPLQGVPDPLRDFTDHQLRGESIPNPPAPDVTADELRIALMQQRIDYNDFARWFNETYGGTTSPEELLKRVAAFEAATLGLGGSLATLPEGIPLTVGAGIAWLIAGYDLVTIDPGTARVPELGP